MVRSDSTNGAVFIFIVVEDKSFGIGPVVILVLRPANMFNAGLEVKVNAAVAFCKEVFVMILVNGNAVTGIDGLCDCVKSRGHNDGIDDAECQRLIKLHRECLIGEGSDIK